MRAILTATALLDGAARTELEDLNPAELERMAALLRHWAGLAEQRRALVLASNDAAQANAARKSGVLAQLQTERAP